MVVWGAMALIAALAGFGLLLPQRLVLPAPISWLLTIGSSLFAAWLAAVLAFLLDPPASAVRMLLVIVFGLALFAGWRRRTDYREWRSLLIVLLVYGALSYFVYSGPPVSQFYCAQRLTPSFNWSDSVVSWNGWAVGLAKGDFRPYDNFYPVAWPGIWSLIYRAQNDSMFWFIGKQTLLVLHICLAIVVAEFARRNNNVIRAFYFAFVLAFFVYYLNWPITNGYMDAPVAAMFFIAASLLMLDFQGSDESNRIATLLAAALFAGMAAVTKQAGVLALVMFAGASIIARANNAISTRRLFWLIITAAIPVMAFALIYFGAQLPDGMKIDGRETPNVTGLLDRLEGLVDNKRGDRNPVLHAFSLLNAAFIPYAFTGLAAIAALNFLRPQTPSAQFGILLNSIAIAGFLVFADCCSYDSRNGLWLFAVLAVSAVNALSVFTIKPHGEHVRIRPAELPIRDIAAFGFAAGAALLAAGSVQIVAGDEGARAWHDRQRERIASAAFVGLLKSELLGKLPVDAGNDWIVVTSYPNYAYLPQIVGHTRICQGLDGDCAARAAIGARYAYVISTPTDKWHNFTAYLDTLPASMRAGRVPRDDCTPYKPQENELWGPIRTSSSFGASND